MDVQTIDQNYAQLQQQGRQTMQLIQTLAGKLQAAAAAGDQNAREWQLDLKEIAIAVRDEEGQTSTLLGSIHAMVDNHVQQVAAAPAPSYQQPSYPQPEYQQPSYQQPYPAQGGYPSGGGMLQRFLGGGFGRAIATGAGFGIGDEIIQSIF
ncbi:MAG: hypothetical protein ACRDQ4_23495 [Pseudonocardiaceae bacterium]